ncbi:transposase [Streptomyces sp. NBC_01358]|uniref:transposase n=1 Tax=Streptomyces sp. NBC_01358 TaxID=2903837 RepID=UPI003FCD15BC
MAHEITVIHLASRRNYGVPRITAELRHRGCPVNRSGWSGSFGSTASPATAAAPDDVA